jgi:hypothetical protein
MKVRVLKRIEIEGTIYWPGNEILEVWPTAARKGIISGQLEDIEGNFLAAWTAKQTFIKKLETRKGNKNG